METFNDLDLQFLQAASNENLKILVDYLTLDKDGNFRFTEELTESELYRNCYPDSLHNMVDAIVCELQKFGGNTFMNTIRGRGVTYREILIDVCNHMKVNFNKNAEIEFIEDSLLRKCAEDAIEKMEPEDLKELIQSLDIKTTSYSKQAMVAALQAAIRLGGFTPYKIAVIVANGVCRALLGRGLALAGNRILTRYISIFAGPIGWILTAVWTAIDIAGPAYRVTIPCCIHIAFMRKLQTQLCKESSTNDN